MDVPSSFGYWVRRRRKALDLTQDVLARQVGCAKITIQKIEADERRPSRQIAERLADCLAIPGDERTAFLQAARAELRVERLANPLVQTDVAPFAPTRTATAIPVPRPAPSRPTGTVTFLFTDIERSTQHWEQHTEAMHTALARHDTLLRTIIEEYAGVVVKMAGDGVHAAFARATDALLAAVAAQRALASEDWGALGALRVRMALHTGVTEERDGDYFGPALNRVARLVSAGHGGQILLSQATHELVCDHLSSEITLRDLMEQPLKDLTRPEHIFQVVTPDLPSDFPPLRTRDTNHTNVSAQIRSITAPAHSTTQAGRNRSRMLEKVKLFWIRGVLEQSLHGAALLELGLTYQPEAVARPWNLIVQQPDLLPRRLPASTQTVDIFDELGGEVLILGAPGAGKTTMLLDLARSLIARAEHDTAHPMPIVFNLASWAAQCRSFDTWLVDELSARYQVPRTVGKTWVDSDQIMLLLDGLDEVALEQRETCLTAINQFQAEHGLLDMVVCSRTADYDALTTRLRLHGAIVLQPLARPQIDAYLTHAGDQVAALRTMLQEDVALAELAQTPLMLSIMMLAYRGLPPDALPAVDSLDRRRQHLFAAYVERMFQRRGADIYSERFKI